MNVHQSPNIEVVAKTSGEATFDIYGRLENSGELPVVPATSLGFLAYQFAEPQVSYEVPLEDGEVYDRIPDEIFARILEAA